MSKQLALSAAFSIFAMAAFTLSATADTPAALALTQTGATTQVAAPAVDRLAPALFQLVR